MLRPARIMPRDDAARRSPQQSSSAAAAPACRVAHRRAPLPPSHPEHTAFTPNNDNTNLAGAPLEAAAAAAAGSSRGVASYTFTR